MVNTSPGFFDASEKASCGRDLTCNESRPQDIGLKDFVTMKVRIMSSLVERVRDSAP